MRPWALLALAFEIACAPGAVAPANRPVHPAVAASDPGRGQREPVETDEYTRYELLAPETGSFRIFYEVTAIAPGATAFFNPIRKGSVASGEHVFDRMTGEELRFEVVSAGEARRTGLPAADLNVDYIRVHLPRPVPADGGQVRLLIEKTYKDSKSYFTEGDAIVFARELGIKRNSVLLPAGYELISCNMPSQVLSEPDGRILVSLMHSGPAPAPLTLRARRLGP